MGNVQMKSSGNKGAGFGQRMIMLLSAGTLAALVAGCSGGTSGFGGGDSSASAVTPSSVAATAGEAAFQTTVYAFVNKQGCVKCHGSAGNPVPQFASPDLATAYAVAKGNEIGVSTPLVNFAAPDTSIFIQYAGNGHCDDTPCSDPTVRPAIQAALEQWAKSEVSAGTAGPGIAVPNYMTSTIAIPTTLPTGSSAAPALMRFPLSKLNPSVASLGSAILEVQIELINPTEYRISNPRIEGNSASVAVSGMHVFINTSTGTGAGTEDSSQGNIWDSIVVTAAVAALPSPLSATTPFTSTPLSSTPMEAQVQSAADMMTIGFDSLK